MPIYTDDILREPDDKILDICKEHWEKSTTHYEKQIEDMKRYQKIYHLKLVETSGSKRLQGNDDESPVTFVPLGRTFVDTLTAMMRGILFPDPYAWLRCEMKGDQTTMSDMQADVVRRLLIMRCEQMDYIDTMTRHILQSLICRWSIGYVGWKIEGGYRRLRQVDVVGVKLIEQIKNMGKKALMRILERMKTDPEFGFVYDALKVDRSDFQLLNSLDTRPDPNGGPRMESSNHFMFEKWTTWDALTEGEYSGRTFYGHLQNISKMKKEIQKENAIAGMPTESDKAKESVKGMPNQETPPDNKVLLRYHLTKTSLIITDFEFKYVLFKQRLDGYPLVKANWGRSINDFDSESLLQVIEPMTYDVNFMMNMRRENQDKSIRDIIAINKRLLDSSVKQVKYGDDVVLEFSEDPRACITNIHPPDVTQAYKEDIEFLFEMIDKVAGMNDNIVGQYYSLGRRSATETTDVKEALLTRSGQTIDDIQTYSVYESLAMIYNLEDAHFSEQFALDTFGLSAKDYPLMTRDLFVKIGGNVRIIAQGSAYWQSKRELQAASAQAVQTASQNPVLQQEFDVPQLFVDSLKASGMPEAEKYRLKRKDTDYTIPPESEHRLIAAGHDTPIGGLDNDEKHLKDHQDYQIQLENGLIDPEEFPPQNLHLLLVHIKRHEGRLQSMRTTNPTGMAAGGGAPGGFPGQELSQLTPGNKTSNLENVQVGGPGPAKET